MFPCQVPSFSFFNNQNHLLFQHFGSIFKTKVNFQMLMWSFAALLNFITNNLIISTGYGMFIKRRYMKAKAVAICCSCFEETHYLPEQIAKVSPLNAKRRTWSACWLSRKTYWATRKRSRNSWPEISPSSMGSAVFSFCCLSYCVVHEYAIQKKVQNCFGISNVLLLLNYSFMTQHAGQHAQFDGLGDTSGTAAGAAGGDRGRSGRHGARAGRLRGCAAPRPHRQGTR